MRWTAVLQFVRLFTTFLVPFSVSVWVKHVVTIRGGDGAQVLITHCCVRFGGHTRSHILQRRSLPGNHRHAWNSFWPVNLALPNIGILFLPAFLSSAGIHAVVCNMQLCPDQGDRQKAHTLMPPCFCHRNLFLFFFCRGSSSESTLTWRDTLLGPILKPVS